MSTPDARHRRPIPPAPRWLLALAGGALLSIAGAFIIGVSTAATGPTGPTNASAPAQTTAHAPPATTPTSGVIDVVAGSVGPDICTALDGGTTPALAALVVRKTFNEHAVSDGVGLTLTPRDAEQVVASSIASLCPRHAPSSN